MISFEHIQPGGDITFNDKDDYDRITVRCEDSDTNSQGNVRESQGDPDGYCFGRAPRKRLPLPHITKVPDHTPNHQPKRQSRLCSERRVCILVALVGIVLFLATGLIAVYFLLKSSDIDCGRNPDFKNGRVTYTQGTTAGVMADIQCEQGFEINGSHQITCLKNGSWSEPSECTITTCEVNSAGLEGGFAVLPVDLSSTFVYGSSVNISCEEGFHLFGNSAVSCLEDGTWSEHSKCIPCGEIIENKWASVETCGIQGEILLNASAQFEFGKEGVLTCHIDTPLTWKEIRLGRHISNGSFIETLVKVNSSGLNDTFGSTNYVISIIIEPNTTHPDLVSITIVIKFDQISCEEETIYFCGLQKDEKAIKYVNKSIHVATSTDDLPELSMPDTTLANRNVTILCTQLFGKTEENKPRGKLRVRTKRQNKNLYNEHTLEKVSSIPIDCKLKETWQFVFTAYAADDGLEVACITIVNDDIRSSDTKVLAVSVMTVQLEAKPTSFTVFELASTHCSISNAVGWMSLEIKRLASIDELLYSVQSSDSNSTIISNDVVNIRSQFTGSTADVEIEFNTTCHGSIVEEYICVINVGSFNWTELIKVQIWHKIGTPQLAFSVQIVDGMDTWKDRLFYCEGDVGNPPGHFEIYSNIEGEFRKFLSSNDLKYKTYFGSIENVVNLDPTECTYSPRVSFTIANVTQAMHRKLLQCVVVPNEAFPDETALDSERKVIKVVPADFCETKTLQHVYHPYDCKKYVYCGEGGAVTGVNTCYTDQCFVEGKNCAYNCGTCQRTDIYIDEVEDEVKAESPVEILCIADGYSSGSEVFIAKDGLNNKVSSSNGNGTTAVPGYSATSLAVTYKLPSVQCDDAGLYSCSMTNNRAWTDTVRLIITKQDGTQC